MTRSNALIRGECLDLSHRCVHGNGRRCATCAALYLMARYGAARLRVRMSVCPCIRTSTCQRVRMPACPCLQSRGGHSREGNIRMGWECQYRMEREGGETSRVGGVGGCLGSCESRNENEFRSNRIWNHDGRQGTNGGSGNGI
jgi:hypothetical protein